MNKNSIDMKKIIIIVLGISSLLWCACEDFLDTKNLTARDTSNFPATPADAEELLTGAYVSLTDTWPLNLSYFVGEIMSDNVLGGGGVNDPSQRPMNTFRSTGPNQYRSAWTTNYKGVFRANSVIENIDQIKWKTDEQGVAEKNRIIGESHFLRAYFYFELARMFEKVPLCLKLEPENLPQAEPAALYAQIASDLKTAIEHLASAPQTFPSSGRVTKWAAEGYMAKVYLFYTGYYNKETLPLTNGEQITKQRVIEWLEDCIQNSGHRLVSDFRSLWPYSYRNSNFPKNTIYNYLKINNIPAWVGDGNEESIFSVKYSALNPGYWTGSGSKSNMVCLYYGLRIDTEAGAVKYYQSTFPFGQGWGFGTVNSKLYSDWPDNDLRKKGSILNVFDPDEDIWMDPDDPPAFRFGADRQMEETGFWNKKHQPVNAGERMRSFDNFNRQLYPNFGASNDNSGMQEVNIQDLVIMRFADVLLMAAELGVADAKTYLNQVHQRAIPGEEIEATLENIKNERRWEFAFEGIRYYDLLRWHDEEQITLNQTGIDVWNEGVANGKVSVVYRPETRGFLPIPQAEIELSGNVLKSNPGW
ncbi:membrane protein [Bacteroidia bacterium]|nr:membrane protein [Bacteroidia bacterium]